MIVLDGEFDYQVGDERGSLTAGGLLWLPRKIPHAIANFEARPCRFITVITPSGIEDFFRKQRDYLADLRQGGFQTRQRSTRSAAPSDAPVVGPPLTHVSTA